MFMSIGSYLVELTRWNIKNNGTDAVNTSIGLNAALTWASQQGYSEAVLPIGIYLIDENNPIQPLSSMTFNLGGATLKIRDNSLPKYAIVLFNNKQKYSRITNGRIEGDRYNHTYTAGSTHEFGVGIELRYGVQYITIDNLEILNTTGDAIIGITSFGSMGGNFPKLAENLEYGGINISDGSLTTDPSRIRSKVKIPMISQITTLGYFGLYGNSYGSLGSGITASTFDVIFYKADETFLSSMTDLQFFDEIEVPFGANYARVVLHQSTIPTPSENTILIRTPEFPKHIYIEKCHLHHCRRLGIAISGMKHCYISGCEIHHISGTAPAGAIDIEDGYKLNQYIFIDGNNIYENNYNIICVDGKYINIINNRIQSKIFAINPRVEKAVIENNYFLNCTPLLAGNVIFSNNQLFKCRVRLTGSAEITINSCYFHNTPLNFFKEKSYVAQVNNCKFLYDNNFYMSTPNPGAPLIFSREPQIISNSIFKGNGKEAFTIVPKGTGNWNLTNVSFINIRHKEDRITRLPPGIYTACKFINPGKLGEIYSGVQAKYQFNNCYFEWDSQTLFYLGQGKMVNSFKISNSYFLNNGDSDNAFYITGNWGFIHLSENTFHYPDNKSSNIIINIRNTTVGDAIRIQGNTFTSNIKMTVVKAEHPMSLTLVFNNNLIKNGTLELNDTDIKFDNIIDGTLT